jgi:Asp-tRNA(Asn)/Glu-tRNA(Gln) amidotransferase A subunit family amidase
MSLPNTGTEIAEGVRNGDLEAVQVVERAARRCGERNDAVGAFVHVDWDGALETAAEVDRRRAQGAELGPLAGVPFGVKDVQDCAGMPTAFGSLLYRDDPAVARDCPSVGRLRQADAVPVGKTTTSEFAMDSATAPRGWGTARNPWNTELCPGGSSGGSGAAVAAGLVPFATGTDEGGSVRAPASFCGLMGLKPTHGRIPRRDGGSETDVVGVLAHTARDLARVVDVMSGPSPIDKTSMLGSPTGSLEAACDELDVAGLRAVWSRDLGYAAVEPVIAEVAREAAEELLELAALHRVDREVSIVDPAGAWLPIVASRFVQRLEADDVWPARASELCEPIVGWLEYAEGLDDSDVEEGRRVLRLLERQLTGVFDFTDLILTPTVACDPFPAEGPAPPVVDGREVPLGCGAEPFTMLANLTWIPAISIPAGLSPNGYPVGLQICARWGREDILLRLARIWEQAGRAPLELPEGRL